MSIDVAKSLRSRGYCGLETPDELFEVGVLTPYCVQAAGHVTKHRDPYGIEWATPSQQSGDDRWNVRDEQLRELLSHCRSEANVSVISDDEHHAAVVSGATLAYEDAADRLANILDGEK